MAIGYLFWHSTCLEWVSRCANSVLLLFHKLLQAQFFGPSKVYHDASVAHWAVEQRANICFGMTLRWTLCFQSSNSFRQWLQPTKLGCLWWLSQAAWCCVAIAVHNNRSCKYLQMDVMVQMAGHISSSGLWQLFCALKLNFCPLHTVWQNNIAMPS